MKPTVWTIIKRLPKAIRMYFLVRKLYKNCESKVKNKVSYGYFKLSLAWS
jgi:hypothetical protein